MMQKVVVGLIEINQHLAKGWRIVQITPHSQRKENWYNSSRGTDSVEFWIVALLEKDFAEVTPAEAETEALKA